MSARVRVTDDNDLEVVGHGTIRYSGTRMGSRVDVVTAGTLEGAGPASLRSLRQALIRWRRRQFPRANPARSRVWVGLVLTSEESFQAEHATLTPETLFLHLTVPPSSPALFLDGDRMGIRLGMWRDAKPDTAPLRRLLAPYFKRHEATFRVSVEKYDDPELFREWTPGDGFTVSVEIEDWLPRGATVADAWRLGEEAHRLLSVADGGELTQSSALDLLRARRWDLFRGQPESSWLEAKSVPYADLDGNGKYELAKDVAAFANSPQGGLIVLGMGTKKEDEVDTIAGCSEVELSQAKRQTYRSLVAHWVYPLVDGFEVVQIKGAKKGRGLVVLVVPPQPETRRPFLVHGTISDGEVLGTHVLLPIRREDDTAAWDPAAIHARLRLGENAIAGKQPP